MLLYYNAFNGESMQILLIHSDYLEYEITSKTKIAEEIEDSLKQGRMERLSFSFHSG